MVTGSMMARLLDFESLVRNGAYPNARTFAERYEVSTKTIRRDVEFLRDRLGAPLVYDRQRMGYVYEGEWVPPSLLVRAAVAEVSDALYSRGITVPDDGIYADFPTQVEEAYGPLQSGKDVPAGVRRPNRSGAWAA